MSKLEEELERAQDMKSSLDNEEEFNNIILSVSENKVKSEDYKKVDQSKNVLNKTYMKYTYSEPIIKYVPKISISKNLKKRFKMIYTNE